MDKDNNCDKLEICLNCNGQGRAWVNLIDVLGPDSGYYDTHDGIAKIYDQCPVCGGSGYINKKPTVS